MMSALEITLLLLDAGRGEVTIQTPETAITEDDDFDYDFDSLFEEDYENDDEITA